MMDSLLIKELFDISGPILRWRIASELVNDDVYNKSELLEKALSEQEVQQYVRYFIEGSKHGRSYNYAKMIHGCKLELLENVVYKLWSFGIGKGVSEIDSCFNNYVNIMEYDFHRNIWRSSYGVFQMAELLSLIGFAEEDLIYSKLQQRLNQLCEFCKQGRYDIYVKSDEFRSKLPSRWKDINKIIDPALTTYGGRCYW